MTFDRIGKYQVINPLGTGAHSTILHVRRADDSRDYALKVVPVGTPEERKYLDQACHEFRIAQMLDHPNLIKIFCLEKSRDWLFRVRNVHLLIEYVNGKTLDTYAGLPMGTLAVIFLNIASGMVHMHRRGVFHADLKPNNVLYGRRGEVKVIDYGLAWVKGEKKDRLQGTPEYMAPETVNGKTINEQTEIYNFGAALYRMVTGKPPANLLSVRESSMRVSEKTWRGLFKPVAQLNPLTPKPLAELIQHCLEFQPASRPERMSDVRDAMRRIANELGEAVSDVSEPGL